MFYRLHIKIIEFTGHLSQNALSRRGIWTFQTGSKNCSKGRPSPLFHLL